jgi:hypothetical protein
MCVRSLTLKVSWTHGRASPVGVVVLALQPRRAAALGGGVGRVVVGGLAAGALGEPFRLRVDVRYAHPATAAPRTLNDARGSAEVGGHAAGAAARHTLPRSVRPLRLILAVALLAVHEALTLAFRA